MSTPDGPPPLKIIASPRSAVYEDELPEDPEPSEELPVGAPPPLSMPVTTTLEADEVESFAERLFDLEGDVMGAEPDEACRMALALASDVVHCEASSVLRGTINEPMMRIVAATGPVADELVGRELPAGTGFVGLCVQAGSTMVHLDVPSSSLHFGGMDEETGFRCTEAMCVPVLDDDGLVYGVIELLNPTSRSFLDEDEEAIESIARVLATVLAQG